MEQGKEYKIRLKKHKLIVNNKSLHVLQQPR